MEGKPLIESVHEAIFNLYRNPDCSKKNEANRWLVDFQKSIDAWKVADQLLEKKIDVDLRYFGAQMIRNKITLSFHELPQEEILSLHSSLMQKLTEITDKTENIILTPLCVAVVDLSLQMSTWNNPIYSFLQRCDEIPPTVLLEILRVFPEEVDTTQIRLGANRRKEIQLELSNCAALLNDYLKQVITRDTSPETLLKAIQCFISWVTIIEDINSVIGCELIPRVFQILSDPSDGMFVQPASIESKLHDAATDLICGVVRCIKDQKFTNVLNMDLISRIAAFENAYHMTVAREDEEKSMNYSRIFSELGEAFLTMMIHESEPGNPHFSVQILDLILTCVGHQDYEVSSVTFNFWFSLGEQLYANNTDALCSVFKPYISRLLVALSRQVQMEPDHEGLLDDNDDFKTFREKVCDLVRDVVFVVGSTNTFCQVFLNMQSSTSLSWDQIEANLFIMYSVAWKISLDENEVIPKTVESILGLPDSTHIAVKFTAILILGELRDWFDEHPNYLIVALEYLASNLQHQELSDAVGQSMYGICFAAKEKLRDLFSPLSNILKNLHTYNLSNKSAIDIIRGVMAVLSNLPSEEIAQALKETCWLQAYPLQKIVENHGSHGAIMNNTKNDPVLWLDRLAAVFRNAEQKETAISSSLCVPAFSEIQPVLFQVMDHYQSNVAVMERCCRCIRFGIRALRKYGVSIIPALAEKLVELYRVNGHSCFLYLGSILVDEYGNDSSNWDIILRMIHAFVEPTCALLPDEKSFRDHPDTIDDLFRLCSRTLQRLPIVFLRSQSIWPLLERGIAAVYLDHREANSSVMKFFHEIFDCRNTDDPTFDAVKRETVRQIYEKHGEALVYHLIHASVFKLPSYTFVNVGEVLFDLLQFDMNVTVRWIESSVHKLPNQNSVGSLMASPEQIQIFLKSCEKAKVVKDVSRSLRDFTLYYS